MKISRIPDRTDWHLPPTKSTTIDTLVLTSVSIILQKGRINDALPLTSVSIALLPVKLTIRLC